MSFWEGFIIIGFVHLVAAISPGPDFVLVAKESLTNGKKAGILSTLGITLGLSFHIIYSILGFATIIVNSSTLLYIIKIIGGCYLLYLGYKSISSKSKIQKISKDKTLKDSSKFHIIKTGILCNILNPKAPLYFVSLFTVVINPNLPFYQLLIYGIWIMFVQFAWFSTVAIVLSSPKMQKKFFAYNKWINNILGVTMMALGLKVLMSKN